MEEKKKIIAPTAKEYEILQKNFGRLVEGSPEYIEYFKKESLKAMKDNLQKYGTSRDPSEFRDPPQYSNHTIYKGFAVMLIKYNKKFSGTALDTETGTFSLQSDWFDTEHEAGKQIFKYIDIFRKSTHGRSTKSLAGEKNVKINSN